MTLTTGWVGYRGGLSVTPHHHWDYVVLGCSPASLPPSPTAQMSLALSLFAAERGTICEPGTSPFWLSH